jgi:Tfp pilus assembly protein PilX
MRDGRRNAVTTSKGERGVALVLALWMLVILGLLGAMLLAASNVEIRLAANDRRSQTALYVADAAVQYGRSDPVIYTTIGNGTGAFPTGAPQGTFTLNNLALGTETAQTVNVTFLTVGPPPVGSGLPATYQAQYFSVQATGVSGSGSNVSQVLLESQVGRIIPN